MVLKGRHSVQSDGMRRTEIDGVPCFWAKGPAPFSAALVFRVGRADETLPRGGVSHIAEHLVMPASPPREFERNARVENLFTVFWGSGAKDQVLGFLGQTAASILQPPFHRIETERRILLTEAAGNQTGPVEGAMSMRYGPAGHGLVGYDELGLHGLAEEDVRRWIADRFTSGNAAVWMTGAPLRRFRLELPTGTRLPPPHPAAIADVRFPCAFRRGPDDVVAVSFQARRSVALRSAFEILVARTWKALRYEHGLAYEIAHWYEPLTAEAAHATLWVNCLPHNLDAVQSRLLDLVDDLADRGPTAEELADEVATASRQLRDPLTTSATLHYACCEELFGAPPLTADELVRELEALVESDISSALAAARDELLLIVSPAASLARDLVDYPTSSPYRVEGRRCRPTTLPASRTFRRSGLYVGTEGVSVETVDGDRSTVRFEDCVALLRWRDGNRGLWSRDGFYVHIDPTDWWGGKDAVRFVDARVPEDCVVVIEPDLTTRSDTVESVVEAKLKRRWLVSEELERLPGELASGEGLLTLAEANRGLRAGLLVVTDRRVFWLYRHGDDHRLELSYDDLEGADAKRGFLQRNLFVRLKDGARFKFGDIVPKERAGEIEQLVLERLRD